MIMMVKMNHRTCAGWPKCATVVRGSQWMPRDTVAFSLWYIIEKSANNNYKINPPSQRQMNNDGNNNYFSH